MGEKPSKNKNAFAGKNIEILFRNSIGDSPATIQSIKKQFKIKSDYIKSIRTGIHGEKCDVKMEFECGRNVDVNIKAYKPSAMFNQTHRASLRNFGKAIGVRSEYIKGLKEAFKKKAGNPRKILLIDEPHRDLWKKRLESYTREIIKWSMSSHPSREILALYDREEDVMRLYKISLVLSRLSYEIGYTPRGNIKIGNCFQLQRKGGDGDKKSKHFKTDSKHSSNDIQVKLDIKSFLEKFKPFAEYKV